MIVMTYVCLLILLGALGLTTVALFSEDNASGTLGGAIMFMLVLLALIGVIAR